MHNKLIWIFQTGQIYTLLVTQCLEKIYITALFSNPITSFLLRGSRVSAQGRARAQDLLAERMQRSTRVSC